MRKLLLPLVFLALAVPARADTVVATVDRATPVSAYGGGVLWSERDPATGNFQLWYSEINATPRALPNVPERSVPFDADLGPGDNGDFLAVYSRCTTEPAFDPLASAGPPDYTTGKGCDLYQYDLIRKTEKKLVNASSTTASEVQPTVWKDTIAFARIYASQPTKTYVYVRDRTKSTASRRMPAGSPSTDGKTRAHTTAVELYGRRLALAWTYGGASLSPGSQIRLDDTQTKQVTTVDDYKGGGLTTIARNWPSFESAKLYYGRGCLGDPGGCNGRDALVQYRYSVASFATAPIGRYDLWQTRGQDTTYVLRDSAPFRACFNPEGDSNVGTCQILATAPTYAGS